MEQQRLRDLKRLCLSSPDASPGAGGYASSVKSKRGGEKGRGGRGGPGRCLQSPNRNV